jgi:hypothetical protein
MIFLEQPPCWVDNTAPQLRRPKDIGIVNAAQGTISDSSRYFFLLSRPARLGGLPFLSAMVVPVVVALVGAKTIGTMETLKIPLALLAHTIEVRLKNAVCVAYQCCADFVPMLKSHH